MSLSKLPRLPETTDNTPTLPDNPGIEKKKYCNWPILNLRIRCLALHQGIKHLTDDIIAHHMPEVCELIIGLL